MALHRDIYWVGRQWAVTGYGIQACNQKQKSKFDIEASRLWEDGALENLRAEAWLNQEDFDKALEVAREHFPEPSAEAAPVEQSIPQLNDTEFSQSPDGALSAETPKPRLQAFELHIEGWPARFVQPWRIRVRR
jgi:hypothetical protein